MLYKTVYILLAPTVAFMPRLGLFLFYSESVIRDYKEIRDEGRGVILFHYPIPFHKLAYKCGFASPMNLAYFRRKRNKLSLGFVPGGGEYKTTV